MRYVIEEYDSLIKIIDNLDGCKAVASMSCGLVLVGNHVVPQCFIDDSIRDRFNKLCIRLNLEHYYQKLYELTEPECQSCKVQYSCCAPEYCAIAKQYAEEIFDIQLASVDENATLPFMSESGCIVPPYLRPMCTAHTCQMNSLGYRNRGDGLDQEWTQKYNDIRDDITLLEAEINGVRHL